MADYYTFQTFPFAYYLMAESVPIWYLTLLKVAEKGLGVKLKEIQPGKKPGSNSYIIIPPLVSFKGQSHSAADEEEVQNLREARRLLNVRNLFLYFSPTKYIEPGSAKALGTTFVNSIGSFYSACCHIPRLLQDYEVKHILDSRLISQARAILHDLPHRIRAGKDVSKLLTAARGCTREAVQVGLLSAKSFARTIEEASLHEVEKALQMIVRGR